MDIYNIIEVPDPVLRTKAQPISSVDDKLRAQMSKMIETMYAAEGIGLAANQVGLLNRVIVVDTSRREHDTPKPIALANPEIIWKSEELWTFKEGCLSIPGQYADVDRPRHIRVRYVDITGKQVEMEASNLASICLQHEIDHLDGVLFIDHLTRLKRDLLLRRLEKDRKNAGEVL